MANKISPDPALVARLEAALQVDSQKSPEPKPKVVQRTSGIPELVRALTPDQEILTLIELAAKGGDGQCVLESGRPCSNSQRCKRQGF